MTTPFQELAQALTAQVQHHIPKDGSIAIGLGKQFSAILLIDGPMGSPERRITQEFFDINDPNLVSTIVQHIKDFYE